MPLASYAMIFIATIAVAGLASYIMIKKVLKISDVHTARIFFISSLASMAPILYLMFILPPNIDARSYFLAAWFGAFIAFYALYKLFMGFANRDVVAVSFVASILTVPIGMFLLVS